jgi:hypothetical protein
MFRLTVTPAQRSAGGPRVFQVVSFDYDTETRHLTLTLRDGRMCLALVGQWGMDAQPSRVAPHSIAEAERIHDERALVLMAR